MGETEASPLYSIVKELLAQAEATNEVTVALDVLVSKVLEHFPALADQFQKTGAGVVVLLVGLEVFGKVLDAGGYECDLHFRGTGVAFTGLVLINDLLLVFSSHHHSDILLARVLLYCLLFIRFLGGSVLSPQAT
ncbi:conserved protein of unknown function [Pseudodesulfovibrio profundus]|uniref:Uncharacterized protein n=1 Tax=Pseudodesulfovibrio profundus TaxID=57320 RepID=A0A2C8F721_9BACT|nr:conserved protein of unknown function [Pseudodesulfovibrio profundus]